VPPDAAVTRGAVDDREELLGGRRAEGLEVHVHRGQLGLGLQGEDGPVVVTGTAHVDISINGGATFHVNFASTFSFNQFWNLTIPVRLHRGSNTIKFIAN
jgi:hypothetical protein